MNINDLQPGSFKVVTPAPTVALNVNNVDPSSLSVVQSQAQQASTSANKPGLFQRIGTGIKNTTNSAIHSVGNAVSSASDEAHAVMTHQESAPAGAAASFSDLAHPLLSSIGKLFSPISKVEQGLEKATGSAADSLTGRTQGTSNANLNNASANTDALVNSWAQKHPDAAKELKGLFDAVQVGAAADGAQGAFESAPGMFQQVVDTVKPLANQAINSDIVSNTIGQGAEAAQKATIAEKTATNSSKAAGQIVQGAPEDVVPAQRAVSTVDTSGVKTYQDLSKVLNNKVSEVSTAQDAAADASHPAAVHPDDLTYQGHSYVRDGISQLKEFYTKTNDIPGLNKIKALETKFNTVGLKPSEVNSLARLHGQDLNGFNANGELASGLTKQAAENTRMGMKDTARNILGDTAFKDSDKQLTDLIKTRDLVDKVSDNVNKLQQKVQERGLLSKIGYYGGKGADLVTGGGLKGFISYFIPRGEGLKTLNALDLEKILGDNLKALKKLNAPGISDTDMVNVLNKIIKDGPKQPALPEGTSKGVIDNTSLRLPKDSQSTVDANEIANTVKSKVVHPQGTSVPKSVTQVFSDSKSGRFPSKSSGVKIRDIKKVAK